MRIISKFHDYYDSAQSLGQDFECPYVREEKVLPASEALTDAQRESLPKIQMNTSRYQSGAFQRHDVIVGFCGKLYPLTITEHQIGKNRETGSPILKNTFHYSKQEVDYLEELILFPKGRPTENNKKKSRWLSHRKKKQEIVRTIWNSPCNQLLSIFTDHKVPVFTLSHYDVNNHVYGKTVALPYQSGELHLILNARLEMLQFFRVKPVFDAYQEIYQYISGVLGVNAPKMVVLSEKDKIKKAGFDKMSFRKPPTKHFSRK